MAMASPGTRRVCGALVLPNGPVPRLLLSFCPRGTGGAPTMSEAVPHCVGSRRPVQRCFFCCCCCCCCCRCCHCFFYTRTRASRLAELATDWLSVLRDCC